MKLEEIRTSSISTSTVVVATVLRSTVVPRSTSYSSPSLCSSSSSPPSKKSSSIIVLLLIGRSSSSSQRSPHQQHPHTKNKPKQGARAQSINNKQKLNAEATTSLVPRTARRGRWWLRPLPAARPRPRARRPRPPAPRPPQQEQQQRSRAHFCRPLGRSSCWWWPRPAAGAARRRVRQNGYHLITVGVSKLNLTKKKLSYL